MVRFVDKNGHQKTCAMMRLEYVLKMQTPLWDQLKFYHVQTHVEEI